MATSSTITKFMKLSQEEYNTLSTSGSLTKDGTTYTYSPTDTIYVTPENEVYQAGDNITISDGVISADVPTDVSELNNDADYQNAQDVTDAITEAIGDITSFEYEVVQTLPVTGEKGVIYLISNSGTTPNFYDEYIWINNAFEKIGTTEVDLSNYYTKTETDELLDDKQDTLVSGTNIKTINGIALPGSGNIETKEVFNATTGITSASDILTASQNGKVIVVSDSTKKYTISSVSGSGNNATLITTDKNGLDGIIVTYNVTNTMWMRLDTPIPDSLSIKSDLADKLDKLQQTSAGGYIVVNNNDGTVEASDTTVQALKEMFRMKEMDITVSDITLPYCTEEVNNVDIPNIDFNITGVESDDYQIVGMISYEVFSGSSRINAFPVCQFTLNGQTTLRTRWMCAGNSRKSVTRINCKLLLKHR